MTTYTCTAGHSSNSADYCDVCGAPIVTPPGSPGAQSAPSLAPAPSAQPLSGAVKPSTRDAGNDKPCPNCGQVSLADALFCDNCGYDFTTGQRPPAPAESQPVAPPAVPVEWVVEVWVDPDWYAAQAGASPDACPPAGAPALVGVRSSPLLVGRASKSRNIHPDVDCGADSAVSHRHAQLLLDHDQWSVLDLQSTNGTFVGRAGAQLPTQPLEPAPTALAENDRVYIGSFTRLIVRRATAQEQTTL